MNLKEQLAAKKAELAALKSGIEAEDPEAIKSGAELSDAIAELNESIAKAEKAAQALASIGTDEESTEEETMTNTPAKSLGDHFIKNMGEHGRRFQLTVGDFQKDSTPTTMTTPASIQPAITTYDTNIVEAPRTQLVIRDLFGAETISGNALTFWREGATVGTIGTIAEGAKKSQLQFSDPTPVTVSLDKLAAYVKESDELIDDAPFIASTINGRLLYELGLKEQNYLTGKLTGTSGVQTGTWAKNGDATVIADAILAAAADVQEQSGYAADAVVINPALYMKLRTGKDGESRYYGGGYFGEQSIPSIWGLPAVVTSAVNSIIVGAFKPCASVVSKGGVSVEAANTNEDDFVKNLMTIRAEERLALAVRRPAGFKVLTEASS